MSVRKKNNHLSSIMSHHDTDTTAMPSQEKQQQQGEEEDVGKTSSPGKTTENVLFVWDTIIGSTIRLGSDTVNTTEHIQNNDKKEFLLFYFAAKTSRACQTFTPKLLEFYQTMNHHVTTGKDNKQTKKHHMIEIIYVPSDRTVEEFEEYYTTTKTPWYAIDIVQNATKRLLYEKFRITTIPTIIVLDAKMGLWITADGYNDILKHPKNDNYNDVIEKWRSMTPISINVGVAITLSQPKNHSLTIFQRLLLIILFGSFFFSQYLYYYYIKGNYESTAVLMTNDTTSEDEF